MNLRQQQLIKYLIEHEDYKTLNFYSGLLNVSSKTLSRDIPVIDSYLKKFDATVLSTSGKGIKIVFNKTNKLEVLNSLQLDSYITKVNEKKSIYSVDKDARRLDILLNLIFKINVRTSIKELTNKYFISRSSIENDLFNIKTFLEVYNIGYSQNKRGISLFGNEIQIREILSDFILHLIDPNYSKFYESGFKVLKNYNYSLLPETLDIIFKIFDNNKVNQIVEVLHKVEKDFDYKFDEPEFLKLLSNFLVIIYRVTNSSFISKVEDISNKPLIKSKIIENYSVKLCENLEKIFNHKFKEYEVNGIYRLLVSTELLNFKTVDDINEGNINEIRSFVKNISYSIGKISKYNFNLSVNLEEELLSYVIPLRNRMHFKTKRSIGIFADLLINYKPLYLACELVIRKQCKDSNLSNIDIEEIGNIMLYYQNIIENSKSDFNVIIVSNCSYNVTQLLITKLLSNFSNWNILNVIAYNDIKTQNFNQSDLVISTVILNESEIDVPYIFVYPLIGQRDITEITKALEKINGNSEFIRSPEEFKKYISFLNYLGVDVVIEENNKLLSIPKYYEVQSQISNVYFTLNKLNKSIVEFSTKENEIFVNVTTSEESSIVLLSFLYKTIDFLEQLSFCDLKKIIKEIKKDR